jgi:hypothetical protein
MSDVKEESREFKTDEDFDKLVQQVVKVEDGLL